MKLLDYLKEIGEMNPFIICVNANCDAFRKAKDGMFDANDIDELTFFRSYARNILKDKKASELLKDVDYLVSSKETEITEENVFLVTVSCDHDYASIKNDLKELLY